MSIPSISIIGLGALGTALTKALAEHDIKVKSVFNCSGKKAQQIARRYDIPIASSFPTRADELGELIFLTVPDGVIAETTQKLVDMEGSCSGKKVIHCSGNESAAVLSVLKEEGVRTASMHPLQTFNRHSGSGDFRNIYFSLQGDKELFPTLEVLAQTLGAKTLRVDEQQKAYLHAAAVMASNYLVTLLDAAAETGSLSGIDDHELREVLHPLIKTTFENASTGSFAETISGPIARGDIETVKKHLDLLSANKELRTFYAVLGLKTVNRAETTGKLEQAPAEKLRQLFNQARSDERLL